MLRHVCGCREVVGEVEPKLWRERLAPESTMKGQWSRNLGTLCMSFCSVASTLLTMKCQWISPTLVFRLKDCTYQFGDSGWQQASNIVLGGAVGEHKCVGRPASAASIGIALLARESIRAAPHVVSSSALAHIRPRLPAALQQSACAAATFIVPCVALNIPTARDGCDPEGLHSLTGITAEIGVSTVARNPATTTPIAVRGARAHPDVDGGGGCRKRNEKGRIDHDDDGQRRVMNGW